MKTLLTALPLLLIVAALIAAIAFLPQTNLDIRPRAGEGDIFTPQIPRVLVEPTLSPTLDSTLPTTIGCSGLYEPVCGSDNVTYNNACEASASGVMVSYRTACVVLRATPTPTPYRLPEVQY